MKPCFSALLFGVEYLKLRQAGHHILPVTPELSAGISHKIELLEVHILFQRLHAAQSSNKIDSKVKLLKIFTTYTCIIQMYIQIHTEQKKQMNVSYQKSEYVVK